MTSVLIVSQGNLAEEMLLSARTIVGELGSFESLCLLWDEDFETAQRRIAARLEASQNSWLILVDVHGSTTHNVARSFCVPGRVEVISGVNLPMVLRLACAGQPESSLEELAEWIVEKARSSISRCSAPTQAGTSSGPARDAHDARDG